MLEALAAQTCALQFISSFFFGCHYLITGQNYGSKHGSIRSEPRVPHPSPSPLCESAIYAILLVKTRIAGGGRRRAGGAGGGAAAAPGGPGRRGGRARPPSPSHFRVTSESLPSRFRVTSVSLGPRRRRGRARAAYQLGTKLPTKSLPSHFRVTTESIPSRTSRWTASGRAVFRAAFKYSARGRDARGT